MNPMEELRAARPAHLGDRPVDEGTRAAELARAMAGPREARRRRTVVRPAWGLGLAGAAAAAVTAVAVVMSGNGAAPTTPRAPDDRQIVAGQGEKPGQERGTGTGPGTEAPGASAAPRVTLPAREVLLAAAERADRQAEGSGDWWHSETVSRHLYAAVSGDYLVVDRQRNEGWTPAAVGGEQWARTRPLGAEPATEADRKAWERAGAPSEIAVVVPGKGRRPAPGKGADTPAKGGYGALTLSTSEGRAETSHMPLADGDKVFWLGRNVTMKELRGLPDEPGALKKWLMASYRGHGTESSGEKMSGDTWLFKVSVGLIMDMPVTPEVRGAAFRMLAELDSVKVTGNVTDAEGRQGTAVSVEERYAAGGVSENRLIFDEATGRGLANEFVVVEPGGMQAGFEPGTVWNSSALIEAGWTDDRPAS
ncbi:CU044_5270 family protein [Nonomuraea candida]|uniref:CU044_5270 family protein n=1 Tax=Nonomuraea candida TaxID=359159 RepID=UPI000AA8B0D2|nr:CU044_5270 family protein [Nonomuraea candida]